MQIFYVNMYAYTDCYTPCTYMCVSTQQCKPGTSFFLGVCKYLVGLLGRAVGLSQNIYIQGQT